MKSLLFLRRGRINLPRPGMFTVVRSLAQAPQGQRTKQLSSPWIYAGRLGGLFSDSAACAPARRIGIEIWETQSWNPAIRSVESNFLKNIEANYQRKNVILFGTEGCSRRFLLPFAGCPRRHDQRHGGKLRLCPRRRYHQS